MGNTVVTLVLAAGLGFLSGLGVGGGSLLILYLTNVLRIQPEEARILNLLFFLPCALISGFFRWRQGVLKPHMLWPAVLSGCVAAFLCSRLGILLDNSILKKLFGGLLIATGLRELCYRQKYKAG